jgi:hypothetical protein
MSSTLLRLSRTRMLFGCGLYILIAFIAVHICVSIKHWDHKDLLLGVGGSCIAPLALLIWSILPKSIDTTKTYIIVRRLILLYVGFVIVFLASASQARPWINFALIGGLLSLVFLVFGPWKVRDTASLSFFRMGMIFSNVALLCGLAGVQIWSYANIGLVVFKAETLAAGRPYCLHVPLVRYHNYLDDDYREVGNLLELRGLAMLAPSDRHGLQHAFHAVLAIEINGVIQWYNWSHRASQFLLRPKHRFENYEPGMSSPNCNLQPHFARNLSWFSSE